jgi:hypothetical protein
MHGARRRRAESRLGSAKQVHPSPFSAFVRVLLPFLAGRRVAIGVAREHDDVGVVQEAVHRGARHQLVDEERVALLDVAVRRGEHYAAFVTLADNLVEVDRFVVLERTQAQAIDDQQVGVVKRRRLRS